MPNRILRDGILRSEKIAVLSPYAELFFRRLMSVVDDFGRYYSRLELLLSDCFPIRPSWADVESVSLWVAECETCGLLRTYEVNSTCFLEIVNFNQRTRPGQVSKFPPFAEIFGVARENPAFARATTTPTTTPPVFNSLKENKEEPILGLVIPDPKTDSAMIVEEVTEMYRRGGKPVPEDHQRLAVQILMGKPPDERYRLKNYVAWAFGTGQWPDPSKTKSLYNLIRDGDWNVELAPRTLPRAPAVREPTKGELANKRAVEINRQWKENGYDKLPG